MTDPSQATAIEADAAAQALNGPPVTGTATSPEQDAANETHRLIGGLIDQELGRFFDRADPDRPVVVEELVGGLVHVKRGPASVEIRLSVTQRSQVGFPDGD